MMEQKLLWGKLIDVMESKSGIDVFPELAFTFYLFTRRLYTELCNNGTSDVFFMSREGQPLLEMFKRYARHRQKIVPKETRVHYLEVSRRSTLLPSLRPLEKEDFETLFRQYRSISLYEFLSSLGLGAHANDVAAMLGSEMSAIQSRLADLPTDPDFKRLIGHPAFQHLYETERSSRKAAFVQYLSDLAGGIIPKRLAIVDVGWKGTIQDNLFNLLCCGDPRIVDHIDGYYLGLVAQGSVHPDNRKRGLVFSSVGERTKRFHVFNENRALFEVMLAADHGSIVSYASGREGKAFAIRGSFEEEEMVRNKIWPVLNIILDRFDELLSMSELQELSDEQLLEIAAELHLRMVFKPTESERNWFESVFHVENYGFFENTMFDAAAQRTSHVAKLKFCIDLVRKKGRAPLGFWPYKTLQEKGGKLVAGVYSYLRRTAL
ncbi:hypothetical protein KTQ42_10800|uniref:hypothetical protein n=1 Tax=Noviherbaspirillum sp. L7-7A TaxID=2850560 RepID=UPI001C2B9BC7|nr:hypothetical protein [Noviherbaspirillum sp. L7-7A]MBV0879791.1 hypothetical protein [Noviherbaspirillum sp. L7-7A]